ncbi:MAG: DNA repair protein RecO [Oscillospiraceae bacterium]|nr:DNA repair protein RecO [Oscillospiraceae bacterium]
MEQNTRGLVLREVSYKEADKILTILTEDLGKITVSARGVRRKMGKSTASSQLLAFSDLTLYQRHGRWSIREGRVLELFDDLRQDIERFALGAYFAELLEAVSDMDYTDPNLLSFGLTGLAVLSRGEREIALIKAAFELRLMCLAGYAPEVLACPKCDSATPQHPMLSLKGGHIHCKSCLPDSAGESVALDQGSLQALRHISTAPEGRVFAFTLGDQGMAILGTVAERYVAAQLERGFRTLEFYKQF